MVENLKAGFAKKGISIGENKIREYLKYYEEKDILIKTQKLIGTVKVDHYGMVKK